MIVSKSPHPYSLTKQDIDLARESAPLFQDQDANLTILINGQSVNLPKSVTCILGECLDMIAGGHGVAVIPVDEEIGTQEAADMLGVSRPYLVKLIDSGVIPSRKVGVQRRLRIADLRAYQDQEKAARRKVLADLAAEGQRLGLGE